MSDMFAGGAACAEVPAEAAGDGADGSGAGGAPEFNGLPSGPPSAAALGVVRSIGASGIRTSRPLTALALVLLVSAVPASVLARVCPGCAEVPSFGPHESPATAAMPSTAAKHAVNLMV